jgi:hypothetical protein
MPGVTHAGLFDYDQPPFRAGRGEVRCAAGGVAVSRGVDVLAVIDSPENYTDGARYEARAAVVELVDAVKALDEAYIAHDDVRDNHTLAASFRHSVGRQLVAAIARKDAALAAFEVSK